MLKFKVVKIMTYDVMIDIGGLVIIIGWLVSWLVAGHTQQQPILFHTNDTYTYAYIHT